MSDKDEEFQQRWGFRRNESDLDSSSDDRSEPSSPSEPKLKKHKLTNSEENNQETINIESDPEAEVHPKSEEHDKKSIQLCKKKNNLKSKGTPKERKPRSRKPKKKISDNEPCDTPLSDLRCYSDSLIQGIKVARGNLLKWMTREMEKPNIQDDLNSSKPNEKGKGQKQEPGKSKFASNSPNKGRRKPSTKALKQDDASSEKSAKGVSQPTLEETVEPTKELETVPNSTAKVASPEKDKRKRPRPPVNKPKVADDQLTSKSAVVALPAPAPNPTPNYLTLPTVIPRPEVENQERNPPAIGDERDFGNMSALSMGINLNSYFPRAQTKDGLFAQFRNANDYEQNTGLKIGNGNGNGNGTGFPGGQTKDGGFVQNGSRNANYEQNTGITNGNSRVNGNGNGSGNVFPFPLQPHPQGLNGGIGMQNPSQFAMQFLSQDNRLAGMRVNGATTLLPNGNHGFLESYGTLNPHLRFKTQGGPFGLQFPDIRGTNFQPRS